MPLNFPGMLQFGNKPCFPIAIQTYTCHNLYMNLFENVIDNKVIDNLSNEQVDMLLEILKDI